MSTLQERTMSMATYCGNIEFTVDHDEMPSSYSATIVYRDTENSVEFSRGGGNTLSEGERPVTIVRFISLGFTIIGGVSFWRAIQQADKSRWHHEALGYFFRAALATNNTVNVLHQIHTAAFVRGVERGTDNVRAELRKVIGIDNS